MLKSLLYLRVKAQQYMYVVSVSYLVIDKKTVLKIWLKLGLNLQCNLLLRNRAQEHNEISRELT